ncbi:MAG: hypothetical protein Q4E36_00505 [Bacillota bacterium]|nr:hypothetical protein [Bacillota bacterium]
MKILKEIGLMLVTALITAFVLYNTVSLVTGIRVDLLREFDSLLRLIGISIIISINIFIYREIKSIEK